MVEPAGAIPFVPYRPFSPAEPPTRGGSEDTRRCDAGRDEPRVDPFRAGPGAVPYPDYLEALNAAARLEQRVPDRTYAPVAGVLVSPEASGPTRRDETLPRLADVSPVEPEAPVPPPAIHRDVYRHTVGTGRLIDVVV